jgi:hypothetical protein
VHFQPIPASAIKGQARFFYFSLTPRCLRARSSTIEEARALTKTIRALAEKGIDVQSGLHERLLRELKAQGTRWTGK